MTLVGWFYRLPIAVETLETVLELKSHDSKHTLLLRIDFFCFRDILFFKLQSPFLPSPGTHKAFCRPCLSRLLHSGLCSVSVLRGGSYSFVAEDIRYRNFTSFPAPSLDRELLPVKVDTTALGKPTARLCTTASQVYNPAVLQFSSKAFYSPSLRLEENNYLQDSPV